MVFLCLTLVFLPGTYMDRGAWPLTAARGAVGPRGRARMRPSAATSGFPSLLLPEEPPYAFTSNHTVKTAKAREKRKPKTL